MNFDVNDDDDPPIPENIEYSSTMVDLLSLFSNDVTYRTEFVEFMHRSATAFLRFKEHNPNVRPFGISRVRPHKDQINKEIQQRIDQNKEKIDFKINEARKLQQENKRLEEDLMESKKLNVKYQEDLIRLDKATKQEIKLAEYILKHKDVVQKETEVARKEMYSEILQKSIEIENYKRTLANLEQRSMVERNALAELRKHHAIFLGSIKSSLCPSCKTATDEVRQKTSIEIENRIRACFLPIDKARELSEYVLPADELYDSPVFPEEKFVKTWLRNSIKSIDDD